MLSGFEEMENKYKVKTKRKHKASHYYVWEPNNKTKFFLRLWRFINHLLTYLLTS